MAAVVNAIVVFGHRAMQSDTSVVATRKDPANEAMGLRVAPMSVLEAPWLGPDGRLHRHAPICSG